MEDTADTRERIIDIAEDLLFRQGYSGTSLADIMNTTQLTKGAFFHHFKSKQELAHTVLTRWADTDDALMEEFVERAQALGETPLQETLIFLKLFEDWLGKLEEPSKGCLFASFTYESEKFPPEMHNYVRDRLNAWMKIYAVLFEQLAETQAAKAHGFTGQGLSEFFGTIVEGGLVLGRALDDREWLIRQLHQFRLSLQLSCDS
ncbi:MAG: TetR/AcrR family transcriptional regulator [Gammaproteobacteria bacterium]